MEARRFHRSRQRQLGRCGSGRRGTLFIDEIDKLSLEAQAGLLHLLEERTYRSLGEGGGEKRANVRFVVGTNAHLLQDVDAGKFREDLYYRINVLPLKLTEAEVELALAYEDPRGRVSVVDAMREAARRFVMEAELHREAKTMQLDHADALKGFVLAVAEERLGGKDEAYRLLGKEALLVNRNHHKPFRKEIEKVQALYEALGEGSRIVVGSFALYACGAPPSGGGTAGSGGSDAGSSSSSSSSSGNTGGGGGGMVQQPDLTDGLYRLQTEFGGETKCLEGNQAGSPVQGGNAFMDDCKVVTGQVWRFVKGADGNYRLKTIFQGDAKCLEGNQAASPVHDGAAFMDDCKDATGQSFIIVDDGDGWYRMKTTFQGDGKCLEGNEAASPVHNGSAFMTIARMRAVNSGTS